MAEAEDVAKPATPVWDESVLQQWGGMPAPGEPGFENPLFEAHFRQTVVGGTLNSAYLKERLWPTDERPVDTDQLIDMIDKAGLWGHEDKFLHVRTMGQWSATAADVQRDNADQEIIADNSLMTNMAVGMATGLADPVNWIPVGRAMTMFGAGQGVLRTSFATAMTAGGLQALQEPAQHYLHTDKTLGSSVLAISAATLLGGIIGATPGSVSWVANNAGPIATRYKNEVAQWFKGIDYNEQYVAAAREKLSLINENMVLYPAGRTVGGVKQPSVKQKREQTEAFDELKAAEERMTLYRDNEMYKSGPMEWTRTVGARFVGTFKPGFLDPTDFIYKRSASLVAREGYQHMAEVNVLLNKNVPKASSTGDAQPTAQAATTMLDTFHGGWAKFFGEMWGATPKDSAIRVAGNLTKQQWGRTAFAEAKRAGFQGSTEDYSREVANAIVSGYAHANPGVQRAAQSYRDNLVEPIRKLAVEAGYPDPGNSPRFALGYLPRNYLVPSVRGPDGKGSIFKQLANKYHYEELVDKIKAKNGGSTYVLTNAEMGQARRRARELTANAYNKITRDEPGELVGGIRWQDHTPGSPFEERVVPIPDAELLKHGMISYNVSDLANNMIRAHVPALLYAKRFKTATGLPDPSLEHSLLPKIQAEYEELGKAATGEARDLLNRERDTMLEVLRNRRDALFHGPRFSMEKNVSKMMERAVSMTQSYQAVRVLSNLLVSSLPDVAGLQIHHGLTNQFKVIVNDITRSGLFKNTRFQGVPKEQVISELKTMGAAIEWQTNSAMAMHMDMGMPYENAALPAERAMHNIAKTFSVTNFSVQWNDAMKGKAARAAMNRVLTTAERGWDLLPDFERQFLANHGIGKAELNRIAAGWRTQNAPMNDGFLRWAKTSEWSDQEAARLLINAVNKNRASTVIQPRSGDKSFFWETNPVGRLINQFQNFTLSHTLRVLTLAEQRVIADGFLGRDSLRVYGGLLQYTMWGALAAYLSATAYDLSFGVKEGEKSRAQKLIDNPGQWLAHGIEKSGVTGLFGGYNSQIERAGIPGITKALGALAGDEAQQNQRLTNWQSLGTGERMVKAFGGPTIAQGVDLGRFAINGINSVAGGPALSKKDMQTPLQTLPWQNNILLRRYVLEPSNKWLWEDQLGMRYNR